MPNLGPRHRNRYATHGVHLPHAFAVDLATILAHDCFVANTGRRVSGSKHRLSNAGATAGETGDFASNTGNEGCVVLVGLSGDELLIVAELAGLTKSFIVVPALEKIECTELVNVLELLLGSLLYDGLIGVDGLMGSGTRLGR